MFVRPYGFTGKPRVFNWFLGNLAGQVTDATVVVIVPSVRLEC